MKSGGWITYQPGIRALPHVTARFMQHMIPRNRSTEKDGLIVNTDRRFCYAPLRIMAILFGGFRVTMGREALAGLSLGFGLQRTYRYADYRNHTFIG